MKVGTSCFIAPEVISSTQYDNKCDVFSFAIIMYQLLTQCDEREIYSKKILQGNSVEYLLMTNKNARPEISENYKKEQFKNYIGFFFLNFFF
jgi:serine/threonine protein kinase